MAKKTHNEIMIERWENVVRVLSAMSPHEKRKHFDMGTWGRQEDCGTIACAAGHCSLDPWFRRRGFTSKFNVYGELQFPRISPDAFFDSAGYREILLNSSPRPVSQVIREIRSHIKRLTDEPFVW